MTQDPLFLISYVFIYFACVHMLKYCVCSVCLRIDVFVRMWCVYIYRYNAEATEGCQVPYFIITLPHSLETRVSRGT